MYEFLMPVIYVFVVLSILLVLRWYIPLAELKRDALEDFEDRSLHRKATIKGVDRESFEKFYVSANESRWALYLALAIFTAIVCTPLITMFLDWTWPAYTQLLEAREIYERGQIPWMFYMFLGTCGIWAFSTALVAWAFYTRTPEPFNAALARARGEPLEDIKTIKPRPKWAKKARPSWAPDLSHLKKKSDKSDKPDSETVEEENS